MLLPLIIVMIAGVAVRAAVAAQGWFYWDDLTLIGTARQTPLPQLLITEHDGHLMPGAWFVMWAFAAITNGFNWPLAVAFLTVANALAAASVAYAAWRISPANAWWVTGLYLLSPLTLAVTTWSAAAVNSLPLHMFLGLWLAHGWLYLASRRRHRDLVIVSVAIFAACLFSERALFAAPVSLILIAAWAGSSGVSRRGVGKLSAAMLLPTFAWAIVYFCAVGNPHSDSAGGLGRLIHSGYLEAFWPTLVGAPWTWDRWHPGPPFASPPLGAIILGLLAAVMLLLFAATMRGFVSMGLVMAYPLVPIAAIAYARSGATTAVEITQTLRHFAEVAVLLALTLAILVRGRIQVPGAVVLSVLALSSLVSSVTYARSWAQQPARDYFTTLHDELDDRGEPIFDQAVPLEVLLPIMHPYNLLSALLPEDDITEVTRDPVLVDGDGNLVPAELYPVRATDAEPGCVPAGGSLTIALDGPLMERDWVVRLNVLADSDTNFTLAAGTGPATEVFTEEGLNQLHIAVTGAGEEMTIVSSGGELCLGRSEVGLLAPTQQTQ